MSNRKFQVGDRIKIVKAAPHMEDEDNNVGKYRIISRICDGKLISGDCVKDTHQFRIKEGNAEGFIYTPYEVRFIRSAAAAKAAAAKQRAKKAATNGLSI